MEIFLINPLECNHASSGVNTFIGGHNYDQVSREPQTKMSGAQSAKHCRSVLLSHLAGRAETTCYHHAHQLQTRWAGWSWQGRGSCNNHWAGSGEIIKSYIFIGVMTPTASIHTWKYFWIWNRDRGSMNISICTNIWAVLLEFSYRITVKLQLSTRVALKTSG